MWIAHTFFYPICALFLAVVANSFFPSYSGFSSLFNTLLYVVQYVIAVTSLWCSLMILRKVIVRAATLFIQLPLSYRQWARYKHLFPVISALFVLSYLYLYLFFHTLIFCMLILGQEIAKHMRFIRQIRESQQLRQ